MQALKTSGDIQCFLLGQYERARELYEAGLRLAEQLGDERAEAWFLNVLGAVISFDGNHEEALGFTSTRSRPFSGTVTATEPRWL